MTFDPKGFLNFANQIYSDVNYQDESSYRTIICRAYYAVFLFSREKLRGKVSFNYDSTDHRIVIYEIKKRINPAISGQLKKCRTKRNSADYKLGTTITRDQAFKFISLATHIINEVDTKII